MKDSLIVLSGGLDSTTMLYEYRERIALAVSFHYGSNHNDKELAFAKLHCERLGIPHKIVALPFFKDLFHSSLLEGADAIPEGNYDEDNMKSFNLLAYDIDGDSKYGFDTETRKKKMKTRIKVQQHQLELGFNPRLVKYNTDVKFR